MLAPHTTCELLTGDNLFLATVSLSVYEGSHGVADHHPSIQQAEAGGSYSFYTRTINRTYVKGRD